MFNLSKKGLLALSVFTLLFTAACDPLGIKGEGAIVIETRDQDDFDQVSMSVRGDIYLHTDSIYRVVIQVEESLLPYLETEVRSGRLDIYFSRNVYNVNDLRIDVYAPNYTGMELNGSGDLISQDALSGDKLQVELSGSGSMLVQNVNFATIKTKTSGSGDMKVEGVADHLESTISGSGDVHALDLPVQTADISISGSGSVRCWVSEHLQATISGSGDVWYDGNPSLDVNISGSGKVRKR
ncbi:MAG: head GIN domain-containing protein [Saprospiraceae bacterium]